MKKEIVGFTAGNFDLIHPGYINTFEETHPQPLSRGEQ